MGSGSVRAEHAPAWAGTTLLTLLWVQQSSNGPVAQHRRCLRPTKALWGRRPSPPLGGPLRQWQFLPGLAIDFSRVDPPPVYERPCLCGKHWCRSWENQGLATGARPPREPAKEGRWVSHSSPPRQTCRQRWPGPGTHLTVAH